MQSLQTLPRVNIFGDNSLEKHWNQSRVVWLTMSDDADSLVRRSRRIAAKVEDRSQLMDIIEDEVDREYESTLRNNKRDRKWKVNRASTNSRTKVRDEETGTLFDTGLQAVTILGATSIDDDTKGVSELCYLVKFSDGKLELVPNSVAHKCCPLLVIDFLESRILFKEKNNQDLTKELFGDTSLNVSHIPDSQTEIANQSVEI